MMGGGIRHTTVPGANNSENWIFPSLALLSANGGVAKKLGEYIHQLAFTAQENSKRMFPLIGRQHEEEPLDNAFDKVAGVTENMTGKSL